MVEDFLKPYRVVNLIYLGDKIEEIIRRKGEGPPEDSFTLAKTFVEEGEPALRYLGILRDTGNILVPRDLDLKKAKATVDLALERYYLEERRKTGEDLDSIQADQHNLHRKSVELQVEVGSPVPYNSVDYYRFFLEGDLVNYDDQDYYGGDLSILLEALGELIG